MAQQLALAVTTSDKDVSGREKLINLMPVKSSGGKYPFKLVATPGKLLFASLPTFPVIGLFNANGRAFAATPSNLYEIASSGSYTDRGLWTMSNRVSFAYNGTNLVMVDGVVGWVFNTSTNTLTQITDPDFYPSSTVAYQDGYFVFPRDGTGQYFFSSLLGTDFDALDFKTAEANPDNLVTLISDHRELFLFGTDTTEVAYTTASEGVFQRNESAFVEKGCAAKYSVAKMNNSVYFVGNDLIVYEMRGYTPVRISSHQIEVDLQDITLDECFAYTYHEEGQLFYVLTIPPRMKTWVFEALTRTWHQRKTESSGRDLSNCSMFFANKTIVGDFQSGNLYILSRSYYGEAGQHFVKTVALPAITNNREYMSISSLEFDVKRAVGLPTGADQDPKAWLRYSKDGGRTWKTHPTLASLGELGEYFTRVKFNRFGRSREFDFELNVSASVEVEIGGAFYNG